MNGALHLKQARARLAHTGETVKDYIQGLKEVDALKARAAGVRSVKCKRWQGLSAGLRCYILTVVAGSDWQRWHSCEFAALPVSLQDAVNLEMASIAHSLRGAAWH